MMPMVRNPVDWDNIDLVVFDMDGTLYDQRRLRARMLMALAGEAVRSRTLRVPAVLQTFRRCRETLGNPRSEERRVGKGCVRTGSSRWSPYHKKKKINKR